MHKAEENRFNLIGKNNLNFIILHSTVSIGLHNLYDHLQRVLGKIRVIIHSQNSSDSVTEPAQAKSHFDKSIAMFTETKMKNELALAYTGYGHYNKKTGEVAKARAYFIKALDIFEHMGAMIEPDKVKKARLFT